MFFMMNLDLQGEPTDRLLKVRHADRREITSISRVAGGITINGKESARDAGLGDEQGMGTPRVGPYPENRR